LLFIAISAVFAGTVFGDSSVTSLYSSVTHGEGTYYGENGGGGHCSLNAPIVANAQGLLHVAINSDQYDGSKTCGMCVEITGHGEGLGASPIDGTMLAFVNNECPSCAYGDLDLAESGDGRWEIEWTAVECPTSGNLVYKMVGSSLWYQKIQIRNSAYPIKSVAIIQGGSPKMLERTPDNHFTSAGSAVQAPIELPMELEITDVFGRIVRDTIDELVMDVEIEGSSNFDGSSDSTSAAPETTSSVDSSTEATTSDSTSVSSSTTSATPATTTTTTTTTTAAPTAASTYGSCAGLWDQCGGIGYNGPTDCCDAPGATCVYGGDYWSNCQPTDNPDSNCQKLWEQCGGVNWTGSTCCQIGVCTYDNDWYYQCRPENK